MNDDQERVNFNAPAALVEEADAVAELLDVSRTDLLIEGLRDRIDAITADDGFQRRLREAFYDGRLDADTVETVLGADEAARLRLLRAALDREPPVPDPTEVEIPPAESFYDEVPTLEPPGTDDGSGDSDR